MKLVMTVSARDEEDVIEANLLYHLNQGVDYIIATDNNSTDGTVEIFERFASEGVLHLIREERYDWDQSGWSTRMARLAATEHGADWVINTDADELWWPRGGTLKEIFETIPGRFGALKAPRLNFIPTREEEGAFWERMTLLEMRSLKWWEDAPRLQPLSPKMAHRGSADVVIGHGNHDVRPKGAFPRVPGWQPILIFHYPLRSYEQFERKVKLIENTPGRKAPERAKLYQLYRSGGLRDFYDTRVLDEGDVADGIAAGRLCVELRLRELLGRLYGRPPGKAQGTGLPLDMSWAIDEAKRARRQRRRLKAEIEKLRAKLGRAERRQAKLALGLERTVPARVGRLLRRSRRRPG